MAAATEALWNRSPGVPDGQADDLPGVRVLRGGVDGRERLPLAGGGRVLVQAVLGHRAGLAAARLAHQSARNLEHFAPGTFFCVRLLGRYASVAKWHIP